MTGILDLTALATKSSTSRVLNLYMVAKRHADDPMHKNAPLFRSDFLNRSIIVKHRLRRDEAYLIKNTTAVATKIIFPLDFDDLDLGGRSVFVNQKGFKPAVCDFVGLDEMEMEKDFAVLDMLNELPSLDPFLVREQLRRNNHEPAECYFPISPADAQRMQSFTNSEMAPLIRMAFGTKSGSSEAMVTKLANALLVADDVGALNPLRETLGLEGIQFTRGIFSWKGFIYYKWQFSEIMQGLIRVTKEMDKITPSGPNDVATPEEFSALKASIRARIRDTARSCSQALTLYDDAFSDLVDRGNTAAFRRFLVKAPLLFLDIGHSIGMISHIASFWSYRFHSGSVELLKWKEFYDILLEFQAGLAPRPSPA